MIPFANLKPNKHLLSELDTVFYRVITSGVYVRGREVDLFEADWARYNNAKFCVSCGSGLDALQLVLRAYGVKHRSAVGVPAWTASSTWCAVEACGAVPVVDEESVNIVVHLYGQRSKTNGIKTFIQDCAQCHGLKVSGTCCWSFYPSKNLGAYGDGGAVTTDDETLALALRELRNHGRNGALNSRLDPLQAGFLRIKLQYLDGWIRQRRNNAAVYLTELANIPGLALPDCEYNEAVWHQFVIRTPRRGALQKHLAERGIQTMVHYPQPPHKELGYDYALPEAEQMAREVLSLPVAPHLDESEILQVCDAVKEWQDGY